MIIMMALLDTIGVASILPFLIVLTDPEIIEKNEILNYMFEISGTFGVDNIQDFIFILGVLVFALLSTSLSFKALTYYFQMRFVTMREYSISKRLIEGYLHQPYSWFLNHNSATLAKNIISEVSIIRGDGIGAMINLISHSILVFALSLLLIIVDPKIALIMTLTLSLAYGFFYKLSRGLLTKFGQKRLEANNSRFTAVSEAFGAIKDVKIGGLEKIYIERFGEPAKNFSKYQALLGSIALLPRYAIEIVIFGGMLLFVLYLMSTNSSFIGIVPIIALYAFAGYRLMPALQQIYLSVSNLRSVLPALNTVHNDLKNLKNISNSKQPKETLPMNKNITLKNICYNYPNTSRTALKEINLTIPAKTTVGLVGATGSGKTTTIDIILGLLEAQKGTLEVDGKVIDKNNFRTWQNSIGYVPQQIYLADDTIEGNIAFGVEEKDIIQKDVESASKIANIHDFIINELPKKYQSTVGERGIRLSGGQRQRIGIARALYNKPNILILDEGTSALDNETEKAVMEAVNKLSKDITIILIAHRLNTVKNCDIIFKLEKGELIGHGTFDELINGNKNFS
tara:strand:- start:217 stop:1923 length:1707 start_codon:yes stop_codon:yes gene_type:complete